MRMSMVALALLFVSGCEASNEEIEDSEETTGAIGSGSIREEVVGRSFPVRVWPQPPDEGWFGQYGYCGPTAVANLLRLHGIEKSPRTAIDQGCWSFIGTSPGVMVRYLQREHPSLDCDHRVVPGNANPLDVLRVLLDADHPPIILFGNGGLKSHWVVVTGVSVDKRGTWVEYMSEGDFVASRWTDLQPRWESVYGFRYPLIACAATSRFRNFRVER
jgi:hypothetical protein